MARRSHPSDPHISNSILADLLIFFSRHRVPVVGRFYMAFLGCDVGLKLPKRTFLPHPYGIVIHAAATLGDDVVIGHQVTIGARNGVSEAATIGDRVYIGAGAKILGKLTIGADAIIGANSVITRPVPPSARAVGANRILA